MIRRFSLLVLLTAGLWGCGESQPISVDANRPPEEIEVTIPDEPLASAPHIMYGSDPLRVGDDESALMERVPAPERARKAIQLPPELGEPFLAKGWQTPTESFGIIVKDDRAALIVHSQEGATEAAAASAAEEMTRRLGGETPVVVERAGVGKYWFWERADQRAMVCQAKDAGGQVMLTEAVGIAKVMDKLRMSPAGAEKDLDKAQVQLYPKRKS